MHDDSTVRISHYNMFYHIFKSGRKSKSFLISGVIAPDRRHCG